MKKYYYLFLTALFAVASLSLVSCSDDDDDNDASYNIVGTWKTSSSALEDIFEDVFDDPDLNHYYNTSSEYTQFRSDGTYIDVIIDEDGVDVSRGTWSLNGDNLTTTTSDGLTVVYTIIDCNSTTMTLSTFGFQTVCTRVSDSVIEQYLNDYDDDDYDDYDW